MKKALLILPFIALMGIFMNPTAKGGCELSIPNNLQACFNSNQINLTVTVSSGVAIVDGIIANSTEATEAYSCISTFNQSAASCPGCPTLVMGNVIESTGTLNKAPSKQSSGAIN
ncbi:MAG TPA: hypothetical protein VI112_06910 [Bacteroidia bacterium]|jgi:hypothetical protein